MLPSPDSWVHPSTIFQLCMFSLKHTSLYHLIWQMIFPCSHNCGNQSFGNLDDLLLSLSATSSSSPWFTLNSCVRTRSHSSIPENLTMSSRQIGVAPFFSGILSLRYPDTNQIWISVGYDGWYIFPGVMLFVLWWPGNMMSCLAPPPGWRTYHYRFLFSKVIHSSMRKL